MQAIFTSPISRLQDVLKFENLRGRDVAFYNHPDFPVRVWGLTAFLTDGLIKTVLEPVAAELLDTSEQQQQQQQQRRGGRSDSGGNSTPASDTNQGAKL